MKQVCQLCEKQIKRGLKCEMEGQILCWGCRNELVYGRCMAFVIDCVLLMFVAGALMLFVSYSLPTVGFLFGMDFPRHIDETILGNVTVAAIFMLLFLIKDGFGGYSLGKYLVGLRVVDRYDVNKPAGLWRSFLRNWILLIMPMVLIVSLQLRNGRRFGDGWAKTRVINQKKVWTPFDAMDPRYYECGYDLRGLKGSSCLECGGQISTENIERIEASRLQSELAVHDSGEVEESDDLSNT
ncbi:RDD family protein [Planctomycetota bacterium]|nr:RDD family protein [Planctomycetota bacterium]